MGDAENDAFHTMGCDLRMVVLLDRLRAKVGRKVIRMRGIL